MLHCLQNQDVLALCDVEWHWWNIIKVISSPTKRRVNHSTQEIWSLIESLDLGKESISATFADIICHPGKLYYSIIRIINFLHILAKMSWNECLNIIALHFNITLIFTINSKNQKYMWYAKVKLGSSIINADCDITLNSCNISGFYIILNPSYPDFSLISRVRI